MQKFSIKRKIYFYKLLNKINLKCITIILIKKFKKKKKQK